MRSDGATGRHEVNPALLRVARDESRHVRDDSRRPRGRNGKGKRSVSYGSGAYGGAAAHQRTGEQRGPRSLVAPSRADVVERLDEAALLPAIVFIFSRNGCDGAVRQLLGSGLTLTRAGERAEIAAVLARHLSGLAAADRRALDYDRFAEALSRGVAAHHAGMLPAFKTCVEECFVRGLTKVVFATETLALGINMPARSVVLEKTGEVQRGVTRRHHPGGVHPADRPGGPARHRRGGPRRRAVAARSGSAGRRRVGVSADLSVEVVVRPHLQT